MELTKQATTVPAPPVLVDAGVVEACQNGDGNAFRLLFESYRSRVHAIALRFTADAEMAHDITQQVFVTLYSALRDFRGEAMFDTWLYRIVANACFHEHRRRRRFVSLDTAPAAGSIDDVSLEGEYLRREAIDVVREAITSLTPKLRQSLVLKHLEGLSYEEIAAIMGCSTGTVASRLNRARSSLATKVAHLRPGGRA